MVRTGRQRAVYTAEELVPDPNPFDVEIDTGKLKKYKSTCRPLIPLIQAGDESLRSEIHKLINTIWNKRKLPDQWKESTIVPIYKTDDKTDGSNYSGMSLLSTSYKMYPVLLSRS
jgi:hypothetical protein